MQLLEATSGRAAALRAYDDLADYLRREFETLPSAETRAIADRLSAVQAPPPPSPPRRRPPPRDSFAVDSRREPAAAAQAGLHPGGPDRRGDPRGRRRVARGAPLPPVRPRAGERRAGRADRRARAASSFPPRYRADTGGLRLVPARHVPAVPGEAQRGPRHVRGPGRPGPQLPARAGRPGAFLWLRHPRRPDAARSKGAPRPKKPPGGPSRSTAPRRRPISSSAGSRWPGAGISRSPDS